MVHTYLHKRRCYKAFSPFLFPDIDFPHALVEDCRRLWSLAVHHHRMLHYTYHDSPNVPNYHELQLHSITI